MTESKSKELTKSVKPTETKLLLGTSQPINAIQNNDNFTLPREELYKEIETTASFIEGNQQVKKHNKNPT